MDVHIKEDFEDLGFRVTVTADDGFDIELHIEPDKDEVSEIYFKGTISRLKPHFLIACMSSLQKTSEHTGRNFRSNKQN